MVDGGNISTEQGEGAAQIFKPQDLSFLDKQMAQQDANRRKEADVRRQRQAAVGKGISSLHDLAIDPMDQNVFANDQKQLYDYAKKNAYKIINQGDADATMEFQKMVANVQNEAERSKNKRELKEKLLPEMAKNGLESYTPEAQDYFKQIHTPLSDEEVSAGKRPAYEVNAVRLLEKEPTDIDAIETLKKVKGQNKETATVGKSPEGAIATMKTEEYTPNQVRQDVSALLTNHTYFNKYKRELDKLSPEEQALYKDDNGKPDPVKYAQDKFVRKLAFKNVTQANLTKPEKDNGLDINIGKGTASNGKYKFVHQEVEGEPGKSAPFLGTAGQTKPQDVIAIQREDSGENKSFMFQDPKHSDRKISLIPKEYRREKDGNWALIAVDKDGKEFPIPENKVTADMKAITGVDLNELLQGGIAKRGSIEESKGEDVVPTVRSEAEYKKLPKGSKYLHNGKTLIKK